MKDASRVLGYPFAMGDRITKAMPPAVMGKDVPLSGIFDPEHKRYNEAGLTMPLLWPPFQDVPVSKTLDDLRRLKEEIMPKVDAAY